MWKFPNLDRETIFIAAPGDVQYLRTAAISEIEQIRARSASAMELNIYDWMVDKSENGFDDWVPAQGQIPLPTDPKCRAVICAFGESIGTPLPVGFPLDAIGQHTTARSRRGYGVSLPGNDADLDPNSFAITGTIFEYLVVLEASQQSAEHVPPALLLFIGDESIRDDTELLDANFGNGRLQEAARQQFKASEMRRWESQRYLPQVAQLRNFIRYVEDQGIVPKIVPDETTACREIRRFLHDKLGLRLQADERDPFKGLESYGIGDADIMYGRDHERRESIAELKSMLADKERPNSLCILGGSGSGKSSFLKAGIFGGLQRPVIGGGYVGFVVLPKDLSDAGPVEAHQVPSSLAALITRALKSIDEKVDCDAAIREIGTAREDLQPAKAVEIVELHLERKGSDWRLLVGIDQFEEILDQWIERENAAVWRPIIQFMLFASRSPRIAVVYTLQLNRAQHIANDPHLGPLWTAGAIQVLGFPLQGLRAIIESTFAFKDIRLEPQLVHELQDRIIKFAERSDPQMQSSLLPLVSMTLHRLYHSSAARAERADEGTGSNESERILRLEDCSEDLDVEDAIATLARSARSSVTASDETLANLLRRLVRLRGGERELLSLPSIRMPTNATEQALAEALIKQRLVLREGQTRIRLVHEAVIHHWPDANAWLKEERIHLDRASALAADAREWQTRGFEEDFLRTAGQRDVDRAADVLSWFFSVLSQSGGDGLSQSDELLRRYCLGLLSHHPDPTRVIESSKFASNHIFLASLFGATDLVQKFIDAEPDSVDVRNKRRRTPLFAACMEGHRKTIEVLLKAGADVEAADDKGWQPIHIAAYQGHMECLERLLARGADVEAKDADGWRAIHHAAYKGQKDCFECLLAQGADVDAINTEGWRAIHLAARYGHFSVVERLLAEANIDPDICNSDGYSPLALSVLDGYDNIIEQLIATNRVDLNRLVGPTRTSVLHTAVSQGALEIANRLLRAGANPNLRDQSDTTPLESALRNRKMAFAELLLNSGADIDLPDKHGQTLLHKAALGWTAEIVEYNPSNIADEIARFLLSHGARVDVRDAEERTPLQIAVQNRNEEFIDVLLSQKVAIDDVGAMTLLHLAARVGHVDVIQSLLEHGLSPDSADTEGWTALHTAAQEGQHDIIALLIDHGCSIDPIANNPPLTPLGAAAETGKIEVIQTLLEHGANMLACSPQRPEPLLLAIKNAQYEAATLLLDYRLLIRDEDASWAERARDLFSQNQQRFEVASLPLNHPIGKRLLEIDLTR